MSDLIQVIISSLILIAMVVNIMIKNAKYTKSHTNNLFETTAKSFERISVVFYEKIYARNPELSDFSFLTLVKKHESIIENTIECSTVKVEFPKDEQILQNRNSQSEKDLGTIKNFDIEKSSVAKISFSSPKQRAIWKKISFGSTIIPTLLILFAITVLSAPELSSLLRILMILIIIISMITIIEGTKYSFNTINLNRGGILIVITPTQVTVVGAYSPVDFSIHLEEIKGFSLYNQYYEIGIVLDEKIIFKYSKYLQNQFFNQNELLTIIEKLNKVLKKAKLKLDGSLFYG